MAHYLVRFTLAPNLAVEMDTTAGNAYGAVSKCWFQLASILGPRTADHLPMSGLSVCEIVGGLEKPPAADN